MTIGQKIREIRLLKKMTLKQIAVKTELSIPFLSQLERDKCSATMGSLRNIADVLGVHPSAFFDYNELTEPSVVNQNDFDYRDLSNHINSIFKPIKITIQPNSQISKHISHKGTEFVYCLEGTLTLVVGDENYNLTPHQSYMYQATEPHYWYNHTQEIVTFLVVNET